MRNALGTPSTVLVLGGRSEIGVAIARELVTRGARTVVLAARRPDELDAETAALRAAGATTVDTVAFEGDDVDSHPKVIDDVVARHGDVDVAVVAFGVLGDQAVAETDPAAAVAIARTNYLAPVSVLTVLAERMRRQGHGQIVVLSSVAGERVRRANYVYGSTKAGLDGFAQGLSDALVGSGVQVLVVRPGFVRTRMTEGMPPAPLATTAEAVAVATADGLRGGAHTVWVPGLFRYVMMLLRHAPRAVWRRMPR